MTTKEWLSRATNIDKEIGRLLREKRAAWDRATSITARLNANCVTGTKDPHKYDTLVAYENLIDAKVDELYAVKQEIQAAIMAVEDHRLREVLQRRYIGGEKWEQIAVGMGYNYRWIIKLHGQALQKVKIGP